MTTGLRRLLATAFIAALAGLGVITALRGRRRRMRLSASAEELVPVAIPSPVLAKATRRGPSYALKGALVGLLLLGGLAGVLFASREALFGLGSSATGGDTRTLAVLPPLDSAPSRGPAREAEITTGSLRVTDPASAVPGAEDRPAASTRTGSTRTGIGGPSTPPPATVPRSGEAGLSDTADQDADRRSSAGVADEVIPSQDAMASVAPTLPDKPAIPISRSDDKPAAGFSERGAELEQNSSTDAREMTARLNPPNGGTSATETENGLRGTDTDGVNAGGRAGDSREASRADVAANSLARARTGAKDVLVPGIETARIERGDSLWRISRRTYGEGERYTLIVGANQSRIRDPDLIYPGQVLVLPRQNTPIAGAKRN